CGPWGQSLQALPEGTDVHLWLDTHSLRTTYFNLRHTMPRTYTHNMCIVCGFCKVLSDNPEILGRACGRICAFARNFRETSFDQIVHGYRSEVGIVVPDRDRAGRLLLLADD